MGEFIMIMVLSVLAVYGMFDIVYNFLFPEKRRGHIRCVIIDDSSDKNPEYSTALYRRREYEIIIVTDKKQEYENIKSFQDEKIHIIDRKFFTNISANI